MEKNKVTVKIEDGFLVFQRDDQEIYDIAANAFEAWLPQLWDKNWFSLDLENECRTLLAKRA